MRCLVVKGQSNSQSLQVSRDCVSLIKSLFSQVVATRAAPELKRWVAYEL